MLQMASRSLTDKTRRSLPAVVADFGLDEEASPFGLQGLKRDTMQLLKPECVTKLAATLALRGTKQQIRDPQFVQTILDRNEAWQDEYRVVHLIEKSLWINGRSDLVMTLLKNPSQIPDNPPREIHQALSRAHTIHPDATIWYGVPLFSDETNDDGLPIPLTAAEVRAEAERRIAAAQTHALRWGWFYRALVGAMQVPGRIGHGYHVLNQRFLRAQQRMAEFYRRARRDSKARAQAAMRAEMEHQRFGCSFTQMPEHSTWLGRSAAFMVELGYMLQEMLNYAAPVAGLAGMASVPLTIAKIIPMFMVPMTIVAADPFLFVELPDEPGKLRHLGHWYWQIKDGETKLHLHA